MRPGLVYDGRLAPIVETEGFFDFKTDDQGNDKAFLQAVEHQVRRQGRADSGVILNEEEPTNVNAPKAAGESPDLCSCM